MAPEANAGRLCASSSSSSAATEAAHEHDRKLVTGDLAIDIGEHRPEAVSAFDEASAHWEMLNTNPDGIMARLSVPSIDVDLPIYHGTSDAVLEHGVGHLQGTSLPVGGNDTHSVLTAHTGLAKATLFNNLRDVEIGETFTIQVFGEVLTYEVVETQTILPDETGSLIIQGDRNIIALVTCTPLGINTHRYLVTGERITPTPLADIKAAEAQPVIPRFPWWAVILPAGVLRVGLYIWRTGYPPKPKKAKGGAAGGRRGSGRPRGELASPRGRFRAPRAVTPELCRPPAAQPHTGGPLPPKLRSESRTPSSDGRWCLSAGRSHERRVGQMDRMPARSPGTCLHWCLASSGRFTDPFLRAWQPVRGGSRGDVPW